MGTTDFDETWSVVQGDFGELAKPQFAELAEKIRADQVRKGKVTFEVDLAYDEDTGEWKLSTSAKSSATTIKLTKKARLDDSQLVLL